MEKVLTADQERAKNLITEWYLNTDDQFFVLSGYAGTGKTFLIDHVVKDVLKLKVGEEAVEFVISSKNEDKDGVVHEAADLLYHVMVLLSARDVKLSEVCAELCKRNR